MPRSGPIRPKKCQLGSRNLSASWSLLTRSPSRTNHLSQPTSPAHPAAARAVTRLSPGLKYYSVVRKTPDLVRQEFYGLMMAHFAIRSLIHEAALKADEDPDRLSFVHAARVVRRKLPAAIAIPPSEEQGLP